MIGAVAGGEVGADKGRVGVLDDGEAGGAHEGEDVVDVVYA